MITISQLATYAGVTVRAVRHYHRIGLLAEPERNGSGYRTYDAAAVVRLIRIRTLADAGVPLARVHDLLAAEPDAFAASVAEIDQRLREQIRGLQETRRRIARLAAGEQLALPQSVVGYLDRLRRLGVDDRYVELERDSWIMIAAQVPDRIDEFIAMKHQDLDRPEMVEVHLLLSQALDWDGDDPRIEAIADLLEPMMLAAHEAGQTGDEGLDDRFVDLMDATVLDTSPVAVRLVEIFEERGWRGWTRIERLPDDHAPATPGATWGG